MAALFRARPGAGEFRAPVALRWLVCGAFAVVLGTALDLHWSEFSLVQPLTRVDSRAFRYFVAHHDDASSRLDFDNEPDGVRITGGARRLALFLHGSTVVIETECGRDVPHVHRAFPTDDLALTFEAKSALPGTGITAIAAPRGDTHLYAVRRPVGPSWTEFRVPLSEMGPGGATFPEIPFPFLGIMFEPATRLDLRFRGMRVVRVRREPPP